MSCIHIALSNLFESKVFLQLLVIHPFAHKLMIASWGLASVTRLDCLGFKRLTVRMVDNQDHLAIKSHFFGIEDNVLKKGLYISRCTTWTKTYMQDGPQYGMSSMQVCKGSWSGWGEGVASGMILSVSRVTDQCHVQGVHCLSPNEYWGGFQQSLDTRHTFI